MLYGKLELLGKGIFTLEGTKVLQPHTMALKNALVHAPVVKLVDFHRNVRIPYEYEVPTTARQTCTNIIGLDLLLIVDVFAALCCRSLYDLLDVSDFQVEGLRMEYYDRGDSWEGGFVFDNMFAHHQDLWLLIGLQHHGLLLTQALQKLLAL